MNQNTNPPLRINPERRIAYIDKAAWRLTGRSLTDKQFEFLRAHSKFARIDHGHPIRGPHRDKRELLTLVVPDSIALKFLADRVHIVPNYVEFALDFVFSDAQSVADAWQKLDRYFVKSWHRGQGIRYVGKPGKITRYTGPRKASNVVAIYGHRPCKIDGSSHSLHIEWRARGMPTLKKLGIDEDSDLSEFDHHEFWERRLVLLKPDWAKINRVHESLSRRVCRVHRRQRIVRCGRIIYDPEKRAKGIVKRVFDLVERNETTSQGMVDTLGQFTNIRRCMHRLDSTHLLPSRRVTLFD